MTVLMEIHDLTLRLMRVTWSYFVWQQPEPSIKEKYIIILRKTYFPSHNGPKSNRFSSKTLRGLAHNWDFPITNDDSCVRGNQR